MKQIVKTHSCTSGKAAIFFIKDSDGNSHSSQNLIKIKQWLLTKKCEDIPFNTTNIGFAAIFTLQKLTFPKADTRTLKHDKRVPVSVKILCHYFHNINKHLSENSSPYRSRKLR